MATTMEVVREDRPPGKTMTLADAAEWYGVSQATLYRLLRVGDLHPHGRLGDRKRYLGIDELEEKLRPKPDEERGDA